MCMDSQNFSEEYWTKPCPKVKCRKPVEGLIYVSIPASLGDDYMFAPVEGAYSNAIVRYEANGAVYIYSAEGIPVNIKEGANAAL